MMRAVLLVLALFGAFLTMGMVVQGSDYVRLDDDLVSGSVALSNSSAQYTLPRPGMYAVCSYGNDSFVECGSSPTVTTSAGGYTFRVPSGSCLGPMALTGPKCAHIALTAAGHIVFMHFDPGL